MDLHAFQKNRLQYLNRWVSLTVDHRVTYNRDRTSPSPNLWDAGI